MDWVLRPAPPTDNDGGADTGRRDLAKIAAAVVAMRDGDEELRSRHRDWARSVFLEALTAETPDRLIPESNVGSNPVAMAFVGIANLLRGGVDLADVRTLLEAVSRQDLLADSGFRAAGEMIAAIDDRLPRALLRMALVSCIRLRREHSEKNRDAYIERRARSAIDRECCWLSGESDEPDWPAFPMASPVRSHGYTDTTDLWGMAGRDRPPCCPPADGRNS